jgi:hypothetical protein
MGDLPKKRGAFLDEYGDFIDDNHTTSNIGKKMVRVFAETRATLAGADEFLGREPREAAGPLSGQVEPGSPHSPARERGSGICERH